MRWCTHRFETEWAAPGLVHERHRRTSIFVQASCQTDDSDFPKTIWHCQKRRSLCYAREQRRSLCYARECEHVLTCFGCFVYGDERVAGTEQAEQEDQHPMVVMSRSAGQNVH